MNLVHTWSTNVKLYCLQQEEPQIDQVTHSDQKLALNGLTANAIGKPTSQVSDFHK